MFYCVITKYSNFCEIVVFGIRFIENIKLFVPQIYRAPAVLAAFTVITKITVRAVYTVLAVVTVIAFAAINTFITEFTAFRKSTIYTITAEPDPETIVAIFTKIMANHEVAVFPIRVIRTVIAVFAAHS